MCRPAPGGAAASLRAEGAAGAGNAVPAAVRLPGLEEEGQARDQCARLLQRHATGPACTGSHGGIFRIPARASL